MPVKFFWLALVLATGLNTAMVYAGDPPPGKDNDAEAPSLEFLEFLGDWETDDGEWIDPEELEQIETIDQEQDDNEEQ